MVRQEPDIPFVGSGEGPVTDDLYLLEVLDLAHVLLLPNLGVLYFNLLSNHIYFVQVSLVVFLVNAQVLHLVSEVSLGLLIEKLVLLFESCQSKGFYRGELQQYIFRLVDNVESIVAVDDLWQAHGACLVRDLVKLFGTKHRVVCMEELPAIGFVFFKGYIGHRFYIFRLLYHLILLKLSIINYN